MTREQLTRYLDNLDGIITSDNIGKIRRDLMMPFDCEWNAWVRDETAAREINQLPAPDSASFHEFRIKVLQSTVKSQAEQIDGLRNELKMAHAGGRRLEEQLDAVKIERDAAETRVDGLKSELREAHGVVQARDKRIEELESCDLIRDFSEQSKELAALKKERDEQGNYWPISELLEENKALRNKLDLAVSQHKCAVERADRLDRTAYQLRNERDTAQSQLPAKDREIALLQHELQDLAERNVNLRTAKVAAENELRRIRQASVHCVLPAYKPQREEMWRRALAIILVKSPAIDSQWGKLSDDMRQFITGIFSLILDTLPQLDVTTTRHPSGASESGNRNLNDPHSGRTGNSENGQTSIASEDSTTSPVSGKPS